MSHKGANEITQGAALLAQLDGKPSSEVGMVLLAALAIHSVLNRNRDQTLVEHFDGFRDLYRATFLLVQSTGVEDELARLEQQRSIQP